ncbi:hypothetical protein B0H14DRAFT_3009907 [Mycena olivaceomarginata]|nr:hypothetical protein B0H14DRAFT_3009907 [Mycena olivaceomarginata]
MLFISFFLTPACSPRPTAARPLPAHPPVHLPVHLILRGFVSPPYFTPSSPSLPIPSFATPTPAELVPTRASRHGSGCGRSSCRLGGLCLLFLVPPESLLVGRQTGEISLKLGLRSIGILFLVGIPAHAFCSCRSCEGIPGPCLLFGSCRNRRWRCRRWCSSRHRRGCRFR